MLPNTSDSSKRMWSGNQADIVRVFGHDPRKHGWEAEPTLLNASNSSKGMWSGDRTNIVGSSTENTVT